MVERSLVTLVIECNPLEPLEGKAGTEHPDVEVSVLPLSKASEDSVRLSSRPFFRECEPDDIAECQRRIFEVLDIKPAHLDPMKVREIEWIESEFEDSRDGTTDEYFREILRRVFGLYMDDLEAEQQREIETTIYKMFPTVTISISWKELGGMIKQVLTGDFEDRGYESA